MYEFSEEEILLQRFIRDSLIHRKSGILFFFASMIFPGYARDYSRDAVHYSYSGF